jgi:hypothetical protein
LNLQPKKKELIANIKDLEDDEVLAIYNFTFNTEVIEQYQGGVKDAVINS